MNKNSLISKVVPVGTIISCYLLWTLPLGLGNFTIILSALLALVASALEFGKDLFGSLGFQRARLNIKNILLIAPLVSVGLFLLYYFVLVPVAGNLTGQALDFSDFKGLVGNPSALLFLLAFAWISAAFGEEILWRGYFMRQFARLFGTGKLSIVLNILIFSVLFGYFHAYQGLTGQIVTGMMGMLLAIIFYIRKYDLWFNIAVHGFFDTIALIVLYKGGL